ncbi:T9SS type A sorting domain-containing protein [Hymenobacter properus]|uniref:T9SS type A sorting domain-containing protein n=1 Tax=Hymenobacter properus TaxID=2791026 RepID=A0A931BEY7_9BACT|nr:T9SS type A sorting domain-containing protein [Hymenobacter properus]MBF9142655.1 T9SS type A sorting domain-containing protein [Hymenobacter properus]MBR7721463.1 T9SS type A sorting domain-containing protein [Microvirga sp. SRT04]
MKILFTRLLRPVTPTWLWVLLLVLAAAAGRAQTPTWQSAMMVGGSNTNLLIKATAASASGDLYVAGSFSNFVTIGNTTLQSLGGTDGFVAKWSPVANDFVWARSLGGSDLDQVTAVALNGNQVYLAGTFFSPSAGFGSINISNASGYSTVSTDAFVAKLTDAGNTASFNWAQQLGGTGQDAATALVANGNSVYVGGQFASSTASFGSVSLTNSTASPTFADGFIAKLVDGGTSTSVSWAQAITGPAAKAVNALAVSGANVYATGSFGGLLVNFGGSSLPNAGGTANAYVAKIADAGTSSTWQWALQAGGAGRDVGQALAVRANRVYVAGSFTSTTMPLGNLSIANADAGGTSDAFLAAVADGGSTAAWQWAQPAGGIANDQATVLTTYGTSGLYLAGSFTSSAITLGGASFANTSGSALVASLADIGPTATANWVQHGGTPASADAACLALAGARLYVAGSFQRTATFGSQTLTSTVAGATNFLATLTDATVTATAAPSRSFTFELAPNPARATTSVQLPVVPGATSATLMLTDALGRTLRTEAVTLPAAGRRHELNLRNLAPGLYLVQVSAGNSVGTQRLVVE